MRSRTSDKLATRGLTLVLAMSSASLLAIGPYGERGRRARPPEWSSDVRGVFFEDARDKLVGSRPDYAKPTHASSLAQTTSGFDTLSAASGAQWSKLIDAETIETEIKRLAQAVTQDVATPSGFKGGAYKNCRRHFSLLAVLFAVAAEHDKSVRWSEAAPALRDQFARAGYNCKVGTNQTYREASERSHELAELVRGSRPQLAAAEKAANWAEVADRPPLMQRIEIAHQERLTPWLANEREFSRNREESRHEAQLTAMLAEVIGREGFEYWDDEQYAQYAGELRQAAADMAAAAELENYEQARQAIGRATSACTKCHEGYRG